MKTYKVWYHNRGYKWGRGGVTYTKRTGFQTATVQAPSSEAARKKFTTKTTTVDKVRLVKA